MSWDEGLPAILGGAPSFPDGAPDWPFTDPTLREALEAALREDTWGKYDGGHVSRLERRLAEWLDCPHVLTCASGTFAVEVALRALGVGAGDEVVLAAYDYPGNFLSVHALGARPVLVDVTSGNWNLDPAHLANALSSATKAVIVSHLHGGRVPMPEVMTICAERGVPVVEDAAQAPGASIEGRLAGTWGEMGVFSFGGSKLLSAGRGGALFTRHATYHQRARVVLGRGNNLLAPLSELQAIVLLPQLDLLDARNARREAARVHLEGSLAEVPGIQLFENRGEGSSAYYKLGIQLDEAAFGLPRGHLVNAMRAEGVALDEGFRALHVGRSPTRWRASGPLEEAERAHRACLVLHHPILLAEEQELDVLIQAFRLVHVHRQAILARGTEKLTP